MAHRHVTSSAVPWMSHLTTCGGMSKAWPPRQLGASGRMLIHPIIAPRAEGICPVPYAFVC